MIYLDREQMANLRAEWFFENHDLDIADDTVEDEVDALEADFEAWRDAHNIDFLDEDDPDFDTKFDSNAPCSVFDLEN